MEASSEAHGACLATDSCITGIPLSSPRRTHLPNRPVWCRDGKSYIVPDWWHWGQISRTGASECANSCYIHKVQQPFADLFCTRLVRRISISPCPTKAYPCITPSTFRVQVMQSCFVILASVLTIDVHMCTSKIYSPDSGTWTLGSPMPWPVGSVQTAAINGLIYACGGIQAASKTEPEATVPYCGTVPWPNRACCSDDLMSPILL